MSTIIQQSGIAPFVGDQDVPGACWLGSGSPGDATTPTQSQYNVSKTVQLGRQKKLFIYECLPSQYEKATADRNNWADIKIREGTQDTSGLCVLVDEAGMPRPEVTNLHHFCIRCWRARFLEDARWRVEAVTLERTITGMYTLTILSPSATDAPTLLQNVPTAGKRSLIKGRHLVLI